MKTWTFSSYKLSTPDEGPFNIKGFNISSAFRSFQQKPQYSIVYLNYSYVIIFVDSLSSHDTISFFDQFLTESRLLKKTSYSYERSRGGPHQQLN
jgi:hypothetical protein